MAVRIKTTLAVLGAVIAGVLAPVGGLALFAVIAGCSLLAALVGGLILRGSSTS